MIKSYKYICKICKIEDIITTNFTFGEIECINCCAIYLDKISNENLEIIDLTSEKNYDDDLKENSSLLLNDNLTQTVNNLCVKDDSHEQIVVNKKTTEQAEEIIDKFGCLLKVEDSIIKKIKDVFYNNLIKKVKLIGKPLDAILAAVISIVCQQNHSSMCYRLICTKLSIKKRVFFKYLKLISTELLINPITNSEKTLLIVIEFIDKLKLDSDFKKCCEQITIKTTELFEGKNPFSIAAACILYTSLLLKTEINKVLLYEISGHTIATINSNLFIILKNKLDITPVEFQHNLVNLDIVNSSNSQPN